MKSIWAKVLIALLATLVLIDGRVASASDQLPDAFAPDSFWNTPLAPDTPTHPDSDDIIDFLVRDNDLDGCITLAGTPGNRWGLPAYAADESDPLFTVSSRKWTVPDEFASLRIPQDASPADNSDGEMVVYDLALGVVAQLSKAVFDQETNTWTVSGGSIAYLDSNGLDGSLPQSDEPRNDGTFRGYPGAVAMVHYDDVASGRIDNVVKIGVNSAAGDHIFPFVGSDGDSTDENAPPQGLRLRIRPEVDLEALGLRGQALTIARGLQEYGMVVGDSTGGAIVLMLEDTVTEGRGELWDLSRESLCAIQGHHLEVVTDADRFDDIGGHLFEEDILWLAEAGITRGCSDRLFCPDDPVTRGQMAAFLSRTFELDPAPSAGFLDTADSIFEDDIDRLFQAGITRGCAPDRFCPRRLVTRGEMAAFLARGFDLPPGDASPFTDIASSVFADEINRLAAADITRGCSPTTFCPEDPVTRGQMAAFLRRAIEG